MACFLLCVATTWRACWVNKRLGSVYKHTASPEPSHGKSKTSEGKEGLKYLLLLIQTQSADTVGKQTVGVRLCTQLQKLPVYIGMLACNHLGPVILKRWSLSLPAVVMNAIILLAELGAVRALWGPRPRNDSDLIKQHKLWVGGRQEIKAFCK